MNLQDLFKCFSEQEKQVMKNIVLEYESTKKNEIKNIREENNIMIINWSNGKISSRLLKYLLDHYNHSELTFSYLEAIGEHELRKIRNIGDKTIREYLSYKG